LITTALDRLTDDVKFIDEVARGKDCSCVCADCGMRMIANKGKIKSHYFSHESDSECKGETALHRGAKRILLEKKYITVTNPSTGRSETVRFKSGTDECGLRTKNGRLKIVDCLMYVDSKSEEKLAIEIKVTHAVEEDQKTIFKELNVPCIQIDISHLNKKSIAPTMEMIEKEVCQEPKNGEWIHNRLDDRRLEQLRNVLIKERQLKYQRRELEDHYRSTRGALYFTPLSRKAVNGRLAGIRIAIRRKEREIRNCQNTRAKLETD